MTPRRFRSSGVIVGYQNLAWSSGIFQTDGSFLQEHPNKWCYPLKIQVRQVHSTLKITQVYFCVRMYLCMNLLYTITWSRWKWIHNEHAYPYYSRNSERINSATSSTSYPPTSKSVSRFTAGWTIGPFVPATGKLPPRARYERNSYVAREEKCHLGLFKKVCWNNLKQWLKGWCYTPKL